MDISKYIKPKSDQLNADDLIGGPLTVRIIGGKETGSEEQPISLDLEGDYKPWKPCKTERRIMFELWGANGTKWFGKYVTVFRDPTARFQGKQVGGIRISGMSDIDEDTTVLVTESRGKKKERKIKRLVVEKQAAQKTETKPGLSNVDFSEKLKTVSQAIADAKITPEASIVRLEKTITLTEAQKKQILDLGKQPETANEPPADPEDGMFD